MTDFRMGRSQVLPPVIKNLIIVNVIVFLLQWSLQRTGSSFMENYFALHDIRSYFFKPHQLITYMFLHGSPWHILINLLLLWFFGREVEYFIGPKYFARLYLLGGLAGAAIYDFGIRRFLRPPTVNRSTQKV